MRVSWCIRLFLLVCMLSGMQNAQQIVWASSTTQDQSVRIGVNLELSGVLAFFGQSALKGMQLAVQEANAQGGVAGKKIQLVIRDNRSEAAYAQEMMKQLIRDEQVAGILGCVASSDTIAAVEWMENTGKQVPVITATSTNPRVTVDPGRGVREFVFRTCFVDPYQGLIMADFAAERLKAKRVAVLTDCGSEYSESLSKTFIQQFTKRGGSITSTHTYLQGDTDYRLVLQQLLAAKPDAVYLPGYYEEAGPIIRQARMMGYHKPMLGGDGWDSPKLVDLAGPENLGNTFFTNHFAAADPDARVAAFTKAYKQAYGSEPNAFAALSYDAAKLMIDAMRRAGTLQPIQVKEALKKTQNLNLVTGRVSMDVNHEPKKPAVIMQFQNGQQVFRERINAPR